MVSTVVKHNLSRPTPLLPSLSLPISLTLNSGTQQARSGFKSKAKTSPIIDVKDIRMLRLIGRGGFGAVYEAKWKMKTVAAKMCLGTVLEDISREIKILTSLPPHSNVLAFYGVAAAIH